MILIENISKSYVNAEALSNISLTFNKGEIIGLLGISGSGKSTFMKILAGLLRPDTGRINVFGKDIENQPLAARKKTGYYAEDLPLYEDLSVMEYLKYIAQNYSIGKDRIIEVLKYTDLQNHAKDKISNLLPEDHNRVVFAQTILHNPKFFLLDEIFEELNEKYSKVLKKMIKHRAENKITLISMQNPHEGYYLCSRYLILHNGQIVADIKTEDIQLVEKVFAELIK